MSAPPLPSWEHVRAGTVGCSDLATLLYEQIVTVGDSAFKDPWTYWHEQAGLLSKEDASDAMELGTLNEGKVLALARRRLGVRIWAWSEVECDPVERTFWVPGHAPRRLAGGVTAIRCVKDGVALWYLKHESGIGGTPDAIGVTDDGQWFVVEAKTVTTPFAFDDWKNEADEYEAKLGYQLQANGYASLLEVERAVIVVDVLGWRGDPFFAFWVDRNPKWWAACCKRAVAFLASLPRDGQPGEPPPLTAASAGSVRRLYPAPEPGKVVDLSEDDEAAQEIADAEEAVKAATAAKERAELAKARVLARIRDAEVVRCGGRKVTAGVVRRGAYTVEASEYRQIKFGVWKEPRKGKKESVDAAHAE